MSKKQFKPTTKLATSCSVRDEKAWFILDTPFASLFPEFADCCSPKEIENLHKFYCQELDISDILKNFTWRFERRFTATLGQAEYWDDEKSGETKYLIRYATRYWIPMGAINRRNTIAHEICHLAVEKLFGHGNVVNGIKVSDHGYHWKLLMYKCGENPKMDASC